MPSLECKKVPTDGTRGLLSLMDDMAERELACRRCEVGIVTLKRCKYQIINAQCEGHVECVAFVPIARWQGTKLHKGATNTTTLNINRTTLACMLCFAVEGRALVGEVLLFKMLLFSASVTPCCHSCTHSFNRGNSAHRLLLFRTSYSYLVHVQHHTPPIAPEQHLAHASLLEPSKRRLEPRHPHRPSHFRSPQPLLSMFRCP